MLCGQAGHLVKYDRTWWYSQAKCCKMRDMTDMLEFLREPLLRQLDAIFVVPDSGTIEVLKGLARLGVKPEYDEEKDEWFVVIEGKQVLGLSEGETAYLLGRIEGV